MSGTASSARRRVAILGFHKIGEPPPGQAGTWFYISRPAFEAFLSQLRERWRVICAETFLNGLDDPESLPARSALITFDDGYRSMREVALPVLRDFGIPSVLFVPTAYIGSTNQFDAGVEPEEAICDWDDLEQLQRGGVSIQSHGATHRRFSMLDAAPLREEIESSKATLERRCGASVRMFSFPYGDSGREPEQTARVLQECGYSAGFLYGGGPVTMPCSHRFAIERIALGPDTDLAAALGDA